MGRSSRLTPLDATFLALEEGSHAHMHVAGVLTFPGTPPRYEDLLAAVERRLHLVPRYRQRLALAPLALAEPEWVDDPHFQLEYHLRHTALPSPGGEAQLRALAGRIFSQRLDRSRPLWEMWLVEGLDGDRFAMLSKTHHALVDGISGVDIMTILFDAEQVPPDAGSPPRAWVATPPAQAAGRLAGAIAHRVRTPLEAARAAVTMAADPRGLAETVRTAAGGLAALAQTALRPAPPSIYNVPIGPHRRFTWVNGSLDEVKIVKNALGGTVNDVVLAAVTGMLRRHLQSRGEDVSDVELIAMVPVSVRTDPERGALGNRVSSMFAGLPVGQPDPRSRLRLVSEEMSHLKEGGQAVGAQLITQISGLAPPTIMAQAARLAASTRAFNLTVTNVPGPQVPLYMLGHRLSALYPMVPLAPSHALGVAIMSYCGRLDFGLVADFDVIPDLDDLAAFLRAELDLLVEAARREADRSGGSTDASAPSGRAPARRRVAAANGAASGRRKSAAGASSTPVPRSRRSRPARSTHPS